MNRRKHSLARTILTLILFALAGCDIPDVDTVYTQEEVDYFLEIALGAEYGSSENTIKKWTQDIKLKVHGTPTESDRQTLDTVISELNDIIGSIQLSIVDQGANVDIHFLPESEFSSVEPNYVPVNYGFFWVQWYATKEIYHARILIATDHVTQKERSHLIREELTQSLGLMNDSDKYIDSIFYQGWTDITSYADIDKTIIEILYREEILPGMTGTEVTEALNDLER